MDLRVRKMAAKPPWYIEQYISRELLSQTIRSQQTTIDQVKWSKPQRAVSTH